MTRLQRLLLWLAAAALAVGATGCPLWHDSYPSDSCERNTDCLIDEVCSDGGVCVPGTRPQEDAGVTDGGTDV
jgi:hypothetical protein